MGERWMDEWIGREIDRQEGLDDGVRLRQNSTSKIDRLAGGQPDR